MQGIILAAGRGSRLKHYTKEIPKTFNKFKNNRFIDLIINNFEDNNIKKINIVTGYKSNLFREFKYNKIFNPKWHATSIFYSLFKAKKILEKNTCIISYSDIVFNKNALKLLKNQKGEIIILNNVNWKIFWKSRFKYPLKDLETFDFIKTKKGNFLTEIGNKTKNYSLINGQFCGLFKITPKGWKKITNFIKSTKLDISKIDITSFFSKFLKKNRQVVQIVNYQDEWHEIDTIKDLKILNLND